MKSDFDVPRIQRIQCTNEAPSTWQIDYIASGILGVYQNPIKGIDKNSAPGKEAGTLTIVIGDVSKATLS
ncbi:MAG: hypothetical protein OEV93_04065 [Candidatus Moranbacteria bacterium]|nr:hypothetical protein [Candidatus Moranbacteria bacterium]